MGEDTIVTHKVGVPLTIVSKIDGKAGKRECLPMYYNNCACCGLNSCGGFETTAKNAKAIKGGAPDVDEMER